VNARVVPSEARLQRSQASTPTSNATWDGTLVLALPSR
jgi:hypothetical protein